MRNSAQKKKKEAREWWSSLTCMDPHTHVQTPTWMYTYTPHTCTHKFFLCRSEGWKSVPPRVLADLPHALNRPLSLFPFPPPLSFPTPSPPYSFLFLLCGSCTVLSGLPVTVPCSASSLDACSLYRCLVLTGLPKPRQYHVVPSAAYSFKGYICQRLSS